MNEFPENQKTVLFIKGGPEPRNEWKGEVRKMTWGIRQMNFDIRRDTGKVVYSL